MDLRNYQGVLTLPRPLRNNNPGSIKIGESWQGAAGDDGVFVTFVDTVWGVRAMARSLSNMIGRGLNTISQLISTWAPASENQTASYISDVAAYTGIPSDQLLTVDNETLHDLIRAIANRESGTANSEAYLSEADIDQGIAMANNPVATTAQAAVVYAQVNPVQAIVLIALAAAGLYFIFDEG